MGAGHGEKASRSQERAIAALLTSATIATAARVAGVGETTLGRWMKEPDFRAEYRAARQRTVENAVATLQLLTTDAVDTLRRNLTCGVPAVEVRAASRVLEWSFRGMEALEHRAEVDEGVQMVGVVQIGGSSPEYIGALKTLVAGLDSQAGRTALGPT